MKRALQLFLMQNYERHSIEKWPRFNFQGLINPLMFWAREPREGGWVCLFHDLEQWFSNSGAHQTHLKSSLKHNISNSGSLRRCLRIWISNIFPGDADTACLGTMLKNGAAQTIRCLQIALFKCRFWILIQQVGAKILHKVQVTPGQRNALRRKGLV